MHDVRHRSTRVTARLLAALTLSGGAGVALTAAPSVLQAQETGRVGGTVTDGTNQPLALAQVSIVGTRLGAVTDVTGRFLIPGITAGTYQLRVQRIGYRPLVQPVTVVAGQTTTANLRVEGAATVLNQVAVVGYTSQARRDVSDATAGVTAADLEDQQFATIEEGLRGRVPGVQINASGEPGRPAQIIVRGQNFFGASVPLYVVDGMYLRQNPNLAPDDIESIEILKDASAAAQYGAQAAGGVIVIRTKRGRGGESNALELRSYVGSTDVPKRINMMDSRGWAQIQQQAYQNANLPVPSGVTDALTGNVRSTDWQDAVFDRGPIQNHTATFSGGTTNANYLLSGGFFDQQGTVIETEFRRLNFRVNSELQRGRFTIGENIALSRSNRQELSGFPLIDVVRLLPTIPVRDSLNASGYGYGSGANPTFGTNPVGLLENRPRRDRSNQVIGTTYAEVKLFTNLRYRLNLGLNYENFGRTEFNSINQIRQGSPNQFAELTEIRNDYTSLLWEHLLNFDPSFREGMHRINGVVGMTSQKIDADDVLAYRRGFSDEGLRRLDAGESANSSNNGRLTQSRLNGFLARTSYTLMERYLFTGSIRRDGSSRFGRNNRYGVFTAGSVGWIASDEPFFQSIPGINRASFLKFRASTGTLGNQDLGDYRTSAGIESNRLGYRFGAGGIAPGATQLGLANPNLQWQQTQTNNAGFDLGLLQDRLTLTADVYRTNANKALVIAPLPYSLGLGEDDNRSPTINAGQLRNTGTEFGLTYRYGESGRAARGFRLNSTASLTTVRNKVISLGDGGQPIFDQTGAARTTVGAPVGTFFLVRTAGIFQNAAEVAAHTTMVNGAPVVIQANAQPGDVRYIDANGDGRINNDDRQEVGNGTPKYNYGMFFDGGWRAFDFALNLRGAGGFKIFNVVRYQTDRGDDPSNFREGYRPFTPENPSSSTPRIVARGNENTRFLSDRWVEDGDFLRVQNIVLGYKLPGSLTSRFTAGRLLDSRVYLNLQNLYTFTGFSNWDPETLGFGNPLGRGIDDGRIYPNVRTVSFGIDLRL